MITISKDNCLDAWVDAVSILLEQDDIFNLIVSIKDPANINEDWFSEYNPKIVIRDTHSLSDVANTIFPSRLYDKCASRDELYEKYVARHNRAKKINNKTKKSWGTYFLRLISFGENKINQLETVITSINGWKNNHKASVVFHTSSSDVDSLIKIMGNPCLQYIELLCPDEHTINMLAVYRNHDFFNKALGNYIGLGQLLKYICDNTGRNVGELVCHSAKAFRGARVSDLKRLSGVE